MKCLKKALAGRGRSTYAAQVTAVVETHTYSNGDVDPQICDRTRVYIKLSDHDHDHDGDDNH